jgi:hypothetical protein
LEPDHIGLFVEDHFHCAGSEVANTSEFMRNFIESNGEFTVAGAPTGLGKYSADFGGIEFVPSVCNPVAGPGDDGESGACGQLRQQR